jgi:hypothetical protein
MLLAIYVRHWRKAAEIGNSNRNGSYAWKQPFEDWGRRDQIWSTAAGLSERGHIGRGQSCTTAVVRLGWRQICRSQPLH